MSSVDHEHATRSRYFLTNYVGSSMNPLLREGDGLHVVPYENRPIRPGDVIVFIPPGGGLKIVHRVVSVDVTGIKTRGNRAMKVDPWVLSPENIIGRVDSVRRKDRKLRIPGGVMGRIEACSSRCIHHLDATISILLRPVYHRLAQLTWLRKSCHVLLRPRVLSFRRPEGMELQLVVRHWLIGRCPPGKREWQIRRPFRLLLDETAFSDNLPDKVSAKTRAERG